MKEGCLFDDIINILVIIKNILKRQRIMMWVISIEFALITYLLLR